MDGGREDGRERGCRSWGEGEEISRGRNAWTKGESNDVWHPLLLPPSYTAPVYCMHTVHH